MDKKWIIGTLVTVMVAVLGYMSESGDSSYTIAAMDNSVTVGNIHTVGDVNIGGTK